jgi:hypothetical protein
MFQVLLKHKNKFVNLVCWLSYQVCGFDFIFLLFLLAVICSALLSDLFCVQALVPGKCLSGEII